MYDRKRRIRSREFPIPSIPLHAYECDHSYHPLSYYLNGGADPTGEHLDMSRVTTSDSAEDIAAGCGVDSLCDPRVSYLDIVESIGVKNAENAVKATANNEKPV